MTRRRVRDGLALAMLAVGAPAAHAGDGGGTSVFALGAGNRALALGGAYTAIADDASAPTWNPAGLALLQQGEFQASGASLYGLDFTEQYAALAYPSWRWGTSALVVRRFGVDGIEHRDDRNRLLPDELQNSEMEVAFSYGRALTEAWNVGASVKARRQSLAGYQDNGVGVDLGLLVQPGLALRQDIAWMNRVALGLTLRNVVQPTLRLDQDSVSDPAAIRAGLSYRHPLLARGSVVAAIDLEKSTKADAHVHGGLEVSPHPMLALRAGVNDGMLTAGTGIRWRQVSVDYVFENNEIEVVHRFGIAVVFGRSTHESRLAARNAEEQEFSRRLADSFAARQQERLAELFAQANELLAMGRPDLTLDITATAVALDPGNKQAADLQAKALFAQATDREGRGELADAIILYSRSLAANPDDPATQAALLRCRTQSDERAERTSLVRELFATALDAFTSGDLVTARRRLRDILTLVPTDAEARAMLGRTNIAIERRVESLLAQAGRYMDGSLFRDAEEALNEARKLEPAAKDLAALTARLGTAEEKANESAAAQRLTAAGKAAQTADTLAAAPLPVKPKAPALSRKKQKEIEDLYRRGINAMEVGETEDALRYWELVWLADPEYQNVADYLKQEYLMRGLEFFSTGSLDEAMSFWEKARDIDPNDEKTLGYLARAREQVTRTREILGR